jgi:ubiquinone biosynthesis monooxygenase Coq7
MICELRSDHAGETGAVAIYDGILAVAKDPDLRRFAEAHRAAELHHLAFFEAWLPHHAKTRLAPLWRAAGFALGALPALIGPGAAYLTIDAVETFVEEHYQHQLIHLDRSPDPTLRPLRDRLAEFQADEIEHRHDASRRRVSPNARRTWVTQAWTALVGLGSAAGVFVARRI